MTDGKTLLPKAVYARRIGITKQALEYHVQRGTIELVGPLGLVCVEDADIAMVEHKHPSYTHKSTAKIPVSGTAGTAGTVRTAGTAGKKAIVDDGIVKLATLHESRAEKAREDVKRAKIAREKETLELEVFKKSVVAVNEVAAEAVAIYLIVRTRLLGLPTKLAGKLTLMSDPHEIKAVLEGAIKEALSEISESLAGDGVSAGNSDGGKRGVKAASKVEHKRVGRPKRVFVARDKRGSR